MADCERECSGGDDDTKPTYGEFVKESIRFPSGIWYELNDRWEAARKRQRGNFDLEQELMLFYRDREVELRNAAKAPTWADMQQLPGVTNSVLFRSRSPSLLAAMMNLKETGFGAQRRKSAFLGRAAQAEALRRVLITAIALERYRGKLGSYPKTLTELTPSFLPTPLRDFMNGQPLCYRRTDDGHFLLYSVGLDGVDNGGKLRGSWRVSGQTQLRDWNAPPPEFDLVWPLRAPTPDR